MELNIIMYVKFLNAVLLLHSNISGHAESKDGVLICVSITSSNTQGVPSS